MTTAPAIDAATVIILFMSLLCSSIPEVFAESSVVTGGGGKSKSGGMIIGSSKISFIGLAAVLEAIASNSVRTLATGNR